MYVNICHKTRCNITDDSHLHTRRHVKLRSHKKNAADPRKRKRKDEKTKPQESIEQSTNKKEKRDRMSLSRLVNRFEPITANMRQAEITGSVLEAEWKLSYRSVITPAAAEASTSWPHTSKVLRCCSRTQGCISYIKGQAMIICTIFYFASPFIQLGVNLPFEEKSCSWVCLRKRWWECLNLRQTR
jgi:hypothetical protein